MSSLLTPWAFSTGLLGLLLAFAPLGVVAYEDKHNKTTRWSKTWTWLLFHTFEVILLTVSSTFAAWQLEHGALFVTAAQCFILPAGWIVGGILWSQVRKIRSQRGS